MGPAAIIQSDTRRRIEGPILRVAPVSSRLSLQGLRGEVLRKSLHMLIAFVPSLAATIGVLGTLSLLASGVLFYVVAEYLRLHGRTVLLVTNVTVLAARPRDRGRVVLGPVTLATGAMLALMLYPAAAASVAIYALAFGDGMASLVGRAFGSVRYLSGKSVEGSLACFFTVYLTTAAAVGRAGVALAVAVVATLLEALPSDDLDNVLLPVGVGFTAALLL